MSTERFPTDFDDAPIPDNLREWVENEFIDGEAIRWMDQPIPSLFRSGAMGIFLFGVPWTAFSVFWMCGAAGALDLLNNKPIVFDVGRLALAAFGIPFLLIGLGMLSFPLRARQKMKRTVYVITDRRVIIIQGTFFSFNVASHYPADILSVSRTQRANGIGDVCFTQASSVGENNSPIDQHLWNIRNVKEVERMMQELKNTKLTEHET